jgi:Bacterial low temperature requirement A protein (LtrA)
MVVTLRGDPLQANFERILAWCVVSSALALGGGFAHGQARAVLWVLAVGVDLAGGAVGFYTPWLGRSRTSDWTIEGGHFAERCQAFILIALGESIVIIGATLSTRLSSSPVTPRSSWWCGATCRGPGWRGSSRSRCWPWRRGRSPSSHWPHARRAWSPPSPPPTGCRGCSATAASQPYPETAPVVKLPRW